MACISFFPPCWIRYMYVYMTLVWFSKEMLTVLFFCCGVYTLTHSAEDVSACVRHGQLCPTLCDPMDCSLLGSSVHGIILARILEWVVISSSRGSAQPRDRTRVSCVSYIGKHVYSLALSPQGSPGISEIGVSPGVSFHFHGEWGTQRWGLLTVPREPLGFIGLKL